MPRGYGNTASEPVFIYTKFGCLLRHPPAVSAALTPYGLRNSHIKPGLLNLFQVSFATMRKKVRRRRRKYTRPSFGSAADFYVLKIKSFFRITSGFVTGSQQGPEPARSPSFRFQFYPGGVFRTAPDSVCIILSLAACGRHPPASGFRHKTTGPDWGPRRDHVTGPARLFLKAGI